MKLRMQGKRNMEKRSVVMKRRRGLMNRKRWQEIKSLWTRSMSLRSVWRPTS